MMLSSLFSMFKYPFLILFITLSNPWIYRITNFSYLLGLCIFTLSLLLTILWQYKKHSNLTFILLILFIFMCAYLLTYKFDGSIFILTPLEKDIFSQRHSYYAQEFGKLYGNRFTIYFFSQVKPYIDHLNQNLANSLDISEFFSWKQKINSGRFFILFLPFFLIGVFNLNKSFLTLVYLIITLIVSSLTNVGPLGPILLLPFINLAIFIGFLKLLSKSSLYKQKI